MKVDFNKHIWEGWRVRDFIERLRPQIQMIMNHQSCYKPFRNFEELKKYCMSNQPYYKKYIPDVVKYFASVYSIKKGSAL